MRVEVYFWILLSWLLGFGLTSLAVPGPRRRRLRIALAAPIGMGLVSLLEFLGLSLGWGFLVPVAELALVVAISFRLSRLQRTQASAHLSPSSSPPCPRPLTWALILLISMALLSFGLRSYHAPHGESDAMNIWNLHARFLFRSPEHWQDLFAPTLDYSHPDYPLLLPGFVASTWSRLDADTPLVPILTAFGFAASLVALLFESLRGRGLPLAASLGAMALVAGTSLTKFSSGQLADVPLAVYYLASVVLLTLGGTEERSRKSNVALAGFCAGLAAWTKNEGQLFLILFVACSIPCLRHSRPGRFWPSFLSLLAGMAPALMALLYFKLAMAPSNDLFGTTNTAVVLEKILDAKRYLAILIGFADGFLRLGEGVLILLLVLLFFAQRAPQPGDRSTRHFSWALITLTLLGYALVYICFSGDVAEHLETSLSRLLFHVWPLMLFALLTLNPLAHSPTPQDT